jgi:DNA-binding CsgD family transcriptional regulator
VRALRRCGELAGRHGLTSRELEILQLVAAGSSRREIAETLVISPATVKTHMRNIYEKLEVHSQVELEELLEQ